MQEKLQKLEQIKAMNFNALECRLWVIKKNSRNGTNSYNGLVVGQYNEFTNSNNPFLLPNDGNTVFIINGDTIETRNAQQLFVVGNGDDENNRSNAMTVTRKGHVGIGVGLPENYLHIADNEAIQLGTSATLRGDDLTIETNASILPSSHAIDLGSSDQRWGRVYTVAGVVTTSDIRLKENISSVTRGLEIINQMTPIEYNLKSLPEELHLGFSAQELEEILPQVIEKETHIDHEGNEDTSYGVKYEQIIPVLVKAIQEQNKSLIELQHEIKILKNK